ncbi:hypothetical protein [Ectobacillus ponti]|uniref:DUF1440 domain-containing protein n=1 Tax=Ectobacillus ponti TaxID=2961894 RepID=A0AA41XCA6_9BACI|nr:hypothetical protein [Ectobacillus ponti]MCP8970290.1 hypothetical protein [Ectobacillus ponti]
MKRGLIAGAWSGIVLGLFFKLLETVTGIKVYTLLLNVDFIPYIGSIRWPEWTEFLFHLFVSLAIGAVLGFLLQRFRISAYVLAALLTFPTIFLYFPLSILSIRDVPVPTDMAAFSLWVLGHALYAVALAYAYEKSPYPR